MECPGEFGGELSVGDFHGGGVGRFGEEDFVATGREDEEKAGWHGEVGFGVLDLAAAFKEERSGGAILVVALAQRGFCNGGWPRPGQQRDGAEQAAAFAIGLNGLHDQRADARGEREAVVAALRRFEAGPMGLSLVDMASVATSIERGDHRREEAE